MNTTTHPSIGGGPLALAATIAGGTLAYADPVRFDNDGSFVWSQGVFLDLTKPAEEQTGSPGDRSTFEYQLRPDSYFAYTDKRVIGSRPDAQTMGIPVTSVRDAGALVPDDFIDYNDQWRQGNTFGYYYQAGTFYTQFDQPIGTPGDPGYIAARFYLNDQTHYGWMSLRVHRDLGPRPNRFFELLAWGYETEPNTPIEAGAVPGPSGALALLAFGAAAGVTRARRE